MGLPSGRKGAHSWLNGVISIEGEKRQKYRRELSASAGYFLKTHPMPRAPTAANGNPYEKIFVRSDGVGVLIPAVRTTGQRGADGFSTKRGVALGKVRRPNVWVVLR